MILFIAKVAQVYLGNTGIYLSSFVSGFADVDAVALSLGVACYETPVGFKYLSQLFKENLIAIGGEEAGGIGVAGYIPERDGSCAFLLLLEMLACEGVDFQALLERFFKRYGRYHYSRTAIPVKSLTKSLDDLKLPHRLCGAPVERINTLDGIKLITRTNWLMLRQSGTEPIVRIYAESKKKAEADELVALGKKLVYAL